MACDLVLAPSFPTLLHRLLNDLREYCQRDPLAPKWLVVPTATVASHLRLRLSQEAGDQVLAGVHVTPVIRFIRHLNAKRGDPPAQRWGPILDLLLYELVEGLSLRSQLGRLKELSSGYRLLRPTFLDLADGGFGTQQSEILEELANDADLTPLERDTLRVYVGWLQLLQERDVRWEPLQHQLVAEWIVEAEEPEIRTALSCEEGQDPTVLVYGFYDFTDVNMQVLAALGRRTRLRVFYTFAGPEKRPHPALHFGESVLEDFKVRLGTGLGSVETDPQSATNYPPSESESFFLATFPDGQIPSPPSFLSFQRASGRRAEAISAALRVRGWLDDPHRPIRPEEILVVARDVEPYLDVVREIFTSFAIPVSFVDVSVTLTPESRAFRTVSRIWEERAPAEWILAHLRDCPGVGAARPVDLDQFELRLREMGSWGGTLWRAILELDGERPEVEEKGLPQFTVEEKELAAEILELWGGDLGKERSFTPRQAALFLAKVGDRWLPDSGHLDSLREALELMQVFRPRLKIRESMLREMLLSVVSDQVQTAPSERAAVSVVPLMRSRGLTARALVMLGLASEDFPARVHEDPLLSDLSRSRLVERAREVGYRLPLKSRITEEMSLLFFLINTSAPYVHWVVPESDDSGRSLAPTPWVQRYIQRPDWTNRSEPALYRIPRGPAQQADYLASLEQGKGSFLPPDFLGFIRPEVARECSGAIAWGQLPAVQHKRNTDLRWNGHVPLSDLPTNEAGTPRVRVTDLEVLARCPYRFYADCISKWKPLRPLEFSEQMSALDWGGLIHYCLEVLARICLDEGVTFPALAARMLSDDGQPLQDLVRDFPDRFPRRLGVLPGLFRGAALQRLVATVGKYLKEVVNQGCSSGMPVEVELRRQVSFPAELNLDISGRIDRVDRTDDGFHVYDYKSGRSPDAKFVHEVLLGYRIQPILYPWMFGQNGSEGSPTEFSFIFLGDDPPTQKPVPVDCDTEEFLKPLADILRRRMYVPTPREVLCEIGVEKINPCQFCDYISLCRRLDRGAPRRYLGLGKQHLASRLESISGVDPKKGSHERNTT